MKTLLSFGCTLFLVSSVAMAASSLTPLQIEGDYDNKNLSLRTLVLDWDSQQIAAQTEVSIGPCSGSVAGIGTLVGNTLRFKQYKPAEGGEACVITVKFGASGKTASITEGDGCAAYHGASCGWEGQSINKTRSP